MRTLRPFFALTALLAACSPAAVARPDLDADTADASSANDTAVTVDAPAIDLPATIVDATTAVDAPPPTVDSGPPPPLDVPAPPVDDGPPPPVDVPPPPVDNGPPPPVDAGTSPGSGPVSFSCSTCAQSRCGSASGDCFGDSVCAACVLRDYGAPACATNAAFQRVRSCACGACPSECTRECAGVPPPPVDAGAPDAGPTPPSSACQSCTARTCISEGIACLTNPTCGGCVRAASTSPACLANPQYASLVRCGCTRCASDCAASCAP